MLGSRPSRTAMLEGPVGEDGRRGRRAGTTWCVGGCFPPLQDTAVNAGDDKRFSLARGGHLRIVTGVDTCKVQRWKTPLQYSPPLPARGASASAGSCSSQSLTRSSAVGTVVHKRAPGAVARRRVRVQVRTERTARKRGCEAAQARVRAASVDVSRVQASPSKPPLSTARTTPPASSSRAVATGTPGSPTKSRTIGASP